MNRLVAVYGSLRKGLHNHRLLEDSLMVVEGEVVGYEMYSLGAYPALVKSVGNHTPVQVEVYEVDEGTFESLDRLEGYPAFYNREVVDVTYEKGTLPCHIYYMQRNLADYPQVVNGDWKDYLEKIE